MLPRDLANAFSALLVLGSMAIAPTRAAEPADQMAAAPTAEQLEFFETSIRPLLVKNCHACHGAEKQEAGLRLDSREALVKGSESGPIVVPNDPEQSRLIQTTRYNGDIQMPPAGKLPETELSALTAWVKMGLPWTPRAGGDAPGSGLASAAGRSLDEARAAHWAFQAVRRGSLPPVKAGEWCSTPIDRFILHALEARGLTPSPEADRRTLLRRASVDVVGLPPTAEEVEAFERDASPDAWTRAVDRLLASPHYGERWGRHWLDIARYADTKGYVFTQDRRYPYSYTYRDYVIRAFNEGLPFDRFIVEQLAADQLPLGDDNRPLAAMGFLTVGRRFMFNEHDIIDDRIDVVARGLLGLTVACARCHDHKYDPIPQADYYSLYGVFASSVEPGEEPLIGQPEESAAYEAYKNELAARQKAFDDFRHAKQSELEHDLRARAADYLARVAGQPDDAPPQGDMSLGPNDLRPPIVRRWREYIQQTAAAHHPVFAPWHELAALDAASFAERARELIGGLAAGSGDPAKPINPLVKEALVKQAPASLAEVAKIYGELLVAVEQQWVDAGKASPAPEKLPDPAAEELRQVLYGKNSPTVLSDERVPRLFSRDVQEQLTQLKRKIDELNATSPAAPPRAMVLNDAAEPREPHIFLRGDPARPGEQVPRRFLAVLSSDERKPFTHGSGRLEMAQAIADRDNPLTARVIVNRVWLQHFGSGLVRTASDFGIRSDPPTHPELLDWLAATFMDEGWSLKKLHRLILLSSTYRQASGERPECAAVDAENRLLWRMNRRRLEFEALRDAYLTAAGRLDPAMGGRPVDLWATLFSTRRTVYGYIDRQDLPGVFRVFDFANPDVSIDQRPRTTVPQQALFAMNSPFAVEQARKLAARPEIANQSDPAARVRATYRIVFARAAEPEEVELALRFVAAPPAGEATKLSPWEMLAQVLLSTNEFVFVD